MGSHQLVATMISSFPLLLLVTDFVLTSSVSVTEKPIIEKLILDQVEDRKVETAVVNINDDIFDSEEFEQYRGVGDGLENNSVFGEMVMDLANSSDFKVEDYNEYEENYELDNILDELLSEEELIEEVLDDMEEVGESLMTARTETFQPRFFEVVREWIPRHIVHSVIMWSCLGLSLIFLCLSLVCTLGKVYSKVSLDDGEDSSKS